MKYQLRCLEKQGDSVLAIVRVIDLTSKTEAQNIAMDFIGENPDRHATIARWIDNKISTIRYRR